MVNFFFGPIQFKGHVQIRQFMTNLAILVICRWTFQFKNKKTNFFFFGAFFQFGELFERQFQFEKKNTISVYQTLIAE